MRLLYRRGGSCQQPETTWTAQPAGASCRPSYEVETRHDAQMLATRRRPVDPYEVWLARRESERELDRLDAHDTWEVLHTDGVFEMSVR